MSACQCNDRPDYPAKVRAKVGQFERIVTSRPGYHCTLTGGNSHGQHGLNMLWVLIGEHGAISFAVYTHWGTVEPHDGYLLSPTPADLSYHSHRPRYEGQSQYDCTWVGPKCYSDGSGLLARNAFQALVQDGEEALWAFLEERYHSWLCGRA